MVAPRTASPTESRAWVTLRLGLVVVALGAAGWLMAQAPLRYLMVALGGLVAAGALLWQPWLGLCGLAVAVPFGPLASISVGSVQVGPAELLLLATLLAWYVRGSLGEARPLHLGGLATAIGITVLTALISAYPAAQLGAAAQDLAKWIGLGAVMLFAGSQLTSRQIGWVAGALLLGGAAQGILGAYQFLTQSGPEAFQLLGRYMRAHGTFGQPNPYAGYLGLVLPLGYTLVLALIARKGTRRRVDWGLAVLAAACGVCIAAGLVLSWSRGALLAAGVALAMVVLVSGRRARIGALIAGGLLVALGPWLMGLTPQGVLDRLVGGLQLLGADLSAIEVTDANFAMIERLAHWTAAWRMFEQRPWLGVGLGQYAVVYPQVAIPRWTDPLGHAHNMYLHVLAEQGLLGAVGLAAFFVGGLAAAWKRIRRSSGWHRAVALGCWGMLWHLAAHSAVDLLFVQGVYLLIGMVLGLMVAASQQEETPVGSDNHAVV